MVKRMLAGADLTGFRGHNLRNTFATLVERASGDLTIAMALIRDKVPGVASRYVTRDLPTLLGRYSPLRQIEDGLSPGLTDGGEPSPGDKERGARARSSLKAPLLVSWWRRGRVELQTWSLQLWIHSVSCLYV